MTISGGHPYEPAGDTGSVRELADVKVDELRKAGFGSKRTRLLSTRSPIPGATRS